MTRRGRRRSRLLGFLVVLVTPRVASAQLAQVHTDVVLEEGVLRRVLASKPAGAPDALVGPSFDLAAHVALLPLVRVGLYLHEDASSASGPRDLVAGGLDVRLGIPWLRGDLRGYLRVGLGEGGMFSAGYALPRPHGSAYLPSASGFLTECPVALGVAYRVYPKVALSLEVGARFGFAFGGSAYASGSNGEDVVGIGASLGVVWGR